MPAFEHDLASLMPRTSLSRRGFSATTLAAGFAASVRPVTAATITTDNEGLEEGPVQIPAGAGQIPAYRAQPARAGQPFPMVIVVQEIFGVHEHIQDVCRRFAKEGYCAVAPELFARQGDVSTITDMQQIMQQVVSKVPDAQVMADLDATVAWAQASGSVDVARLGITGFCWGGRVTWLYAAHNPNLRAGVAWYGRLVGQTNELQPRYPLDVAAEIDAPVLGLYGAADQGIPVESVERMKAALAEAGKPSELVVYPETPHAFHADYRSSYREEAARDGWRRCLAWMRQHGVA